MDLVVGERHALVGKNLTLNTSLRAFDNSSIVINNIHNYGHFAGIGTCVYDYSTASFNKA